MTDSGAITLPEQAHTTDVALDLLVWDAPNIDMTLSNVIGGRPTPASRPRFDAVAKWLLSGAGDAEVVGAALQSLAAVVVEGQVLHSDELDE